MALNALCNLISDSENSKPEAAFIVYGDFNRVGMKIVLPKFYQHISFSTTGDQTLDHGYIPSKDCYKLHPYPALQTTDHSSILLFSAYRQKPEQESLVSRNTFKWDIRKWSPRSDILPD